MAVNINVITQYSNKTLTIVDMDSNIISTNYTNEIVNLPHDTSYIMYLSPTVNEVSFKGMLDISNSLFSGILGYVWILVILVFSFYLIKGVKNYVR